MDKINSVDDLLVHELRDLYSAETQLVEALPIMAAAATAPELRRGFEQHLEQTRAHMQRIEQVLTMLDEQTDDTVCAGMQGLIDEGESIIHSVERGAVLDGALIDAARKVEHYEITAYRGAMSKAHELGHSDIAELLHATLQEEELTDHQLQTLAQSMMPYSGPGADPRDDGSEVIVGSR
jgi:ferritin-like metal-binding protein YciE